MLQTEITFVDYAKSTTPNPNLDDPEYGITSYSSAQRVGNLLQM